MSETFRKGVHLTVIKTSQGHAAYGVTTIKQPIDLDGCAHRVGAWALGDLFVLKPRGSPNIWKVYRREMYGCKMVFKHDDLDVVMAWAALTYGH